MLEQFHCPIERCLTCCWLIPGPPFASHVIFSIWSCHSLLAPRYGLSNPFPIWPISVQSVFPIATVHPDCFQEPSYPIFSPCDLNSVGLQWVCVCVCVCVCLCVRVSVVALPIWHFFVSKDASSIIKGRSVSLSSNGRKFDKQRAFSITVIRRSNAH